MEIERRLASKNKNSTIFDNTNQTTIQRESAEYPENINKFLVDLESCSVHSENHTDQDVDNDNFVTSISEWDVSSIRGTDIDNGTVSLCSGATDMVDYQVNVNDTAGQSNDTFVPLPSTIIRSDSFIVDQPSEFFLKQLEDNGVVPSNSTSLTDVSTKTEINQTKVFVKSVDKRKPEIKKNASTKLKKYAPKPFPFKKGRIASDNISNLPEKLIRKCQSSNVSVVDIRRERQDRSGSKQTIPNNQTRKPASPVESSSTQTDIYHDTSSVDERIAEIVSSIEEKFHNEIVFFLEKQKREQEAFLRKLLSQVKVKQDAFQSSLVMQIKAMIGDGGSTFLKNPDHLSDQHNNSNLLSDVNGNLSLQKFKDDCRQTEVRFPIIYRRFTSQWNQFL